MNLKKMKVVRFPLRNFIDCKRMQLQKKIAKLTKTWVENINCIA